MGHDDRKWVDVRPDAFFEEYPDAEKRGTKGQKGGRKGKVERDD